MTTANNIAFFVSHHGYGHAARACAVMQAAHNLNPDLHFEIFTRAPLWFFERSLSFPFRYIEMTTDIGLVQPAPLREDLPATLRQLGDFLPFPTDPDQMLVRFLRSKRYDLALCDISPFGLSAAHAAGIPTLLIENFTWDWIYTGYAQEFPAFNSIIPAFTRAFETADFHIQTEPACTFDPKAALHTNPVARMPQIPRQQIRAQLQIPDHAPAILVTMGGIELDYSFMNRLTAIRDLWFIIPGGSNNGIKNQDHLVLLPHHTSFYHPDLVNAVDGVVGKAGYSTLAETYYAGIPFAYVSRDHFRESPVLSGFIEQYMHAIKIDGDDFESGDWAPRVAQMLHLPCSRPAVQNGAEQAARFILRHLPSSI